MTSKERMSLESEDEALEEAISVSVRVRPLNTKEVRSSNDEVWKIVEGNSIFSTVEGQTHTFDNVFDTNTTTRQVYNKVARPLVSSVLEGMNGTVFAYGQTASGKTFTMQGEPHHPGILLLAAEQVFEEIERKPHFQFLLRVSYIEVYNEQIKDLLSDSDTNLRIREDRDRGFFVDNLQMKSIVSVEELAQAKEEGERRRHVGETNMNARSSRSHTIFSIRIEMRDTRSHEDDDDDDNIEEEEDAFDKENHTPQSKRRLSGNDDKKYGVLVGNLNLVDLAGSENARSTGAEGGRLKEGGNINKSLLTLSRVISQLASSRGKSGFINWRDSKLTQILQPSLAGNCRTAIVCCITPASRFSEETKSTLNFASRAKQIRTRAIVNEVLDGEGEMRKLKRTIHALRLELASQQEINAEKSALEMKISSLKSLLLNGGSRLTINHESPSIDGHEEEASRVDTTAVKRRKKKHRETWCPGDFLSNSKDRIISVQTGIMELSGTEDSAEKRLSLSTGVEIEDQQIELDEGSKEIEEPLFATERIAVLKQKLQSKDNQISLLKEQLRSTRTELDEEWVSLREEREKLSEERISREEEAKSLQKKMEVLNAQVLESEVQFQESKKAIRAALEERTAECADLREEILRMTESLEEKDRENSAMEKSLKQMKEEESSFYSSAAESQRIMNNKIIDHEKTLSELRIENARLQETLESKCSQVAQIEEQLQSQSRIADTESKELHAKQQQLEASLLNLTEEKVKLEVTLVEMEDVLLKAELEKESTESEIENLKKIAASLNVKIEQFMTIVEEASGTNENLHSAEECMGVLKALLVQTSQRLGEADEVKIADLQKSILSLQETICSSQSETFDLRKRIISIADSLGTKEDDMTRSTNVDESVEVAFKRIESFRSGFEESLLQSKTDMAGLVAELNSAKLSILSLEGSLKSRESDLLAQSENASTLSVQVQSLQRELAQEQQKCFDFESQVSALKDQLDAMDATNQESIEPLITALERANEISTEATQALRHKDREMERQSEQLNLALEDAASNALRSNELIKAVLDLQEKNVSLASALSEIKETTDIEAKDTSLLISELENELAAANSRTEEVEDVLASQLEEMQCLAEKLKALQTAAILSQSMESELRNEIDVLQHARSSAQIELASARARIEDLETEVGSVEAKESGSRQDKFIADQRILELEGLLENAEKNIVEVSSKAASLEKLHSSSLSNEQELRNDLNLANSTIDELKSQLNRALEAQEANQHLRELENERDSLQNALLSKKKALEEKVIQIEGLTRDHSQASALLEKITSELKQAQCRVESLESELNYMKNKLEESEDRFNMAQSELNRVNGTIKDAQCEKELALLGDIERMKSKLQEESLTREELEEKLDAASLRISELEDRLNFAQSHCEEQVSKLEREKELRADLEKKLTEADEALYLQTNTLAESDLSKNEIAQLTKELEDSTKEVDQLQLDAKALKESRNAALEQLEQLAAASSEKDNDLEKLRQKVEELMEKDFLVEGKFQELTSTLEKREEAMANQSLEVDELSALLQTARNTLLESKPIAEIDDLLRELESQYEVKLSCLRQETFNLRSELENKTNLVSELEIRYQNLTEKLQHQETKEPVNSAPSHNSSESGGSSMVEEVVYECMRNVIACVELELIQESFTESRRSVSQLQEELSEKLRLETEYREAFQTRTANLEEQLDTVKKELKERREKFDEDLDDVIEALQKAEAERSDFQRQLDGKNISSETDGVTISELRFSVESLQQERNQLIAELNAARLELQNLHAQQMPSPELVDKRLEQIDLRLNLAVQERDKALVTVSSLQENIKILENSLLKGEEEKQSKVSSLLAQIDQTNSQRQKLEQQVVEKDQCISSGTKKNMKLEEEVDALKLYCQSLESEVADLKGSCGAGTGVEEGQYLDAIAALERKCSSLKETLNEKEEVLSRLSLSLEEAKEEIVKEKESSAKLSRSKELIDELEIAVSKSQSELSSSRSEISELQTRLNRQKSSADALVEERTLLQEKLTALEAATSVREVEEKEAIETMQDALQEKETLVQDLTGKLRDGAEKYRELLKECAKLKDDVRDSHVRASEADEFITTINKLKAQLREAQGELKSSQDRVVKLEAVKITKEQAMKIQQTRDDYKKLKIKYAEVSEINKGLLESQESLRSRLAGLKEAAVQGGDLSQLIRQKARQFGILNTISPVEFVTLILDRMTTLQKDRDELAAQVNIANAPAEVEELQERINHYKSKLYHLEKEHEEQSRQMKTLQNTVAGSQGKDEEETKALRKEVAKLRSRLKEFEEDFLKIKDENDRTKDSLLANIDDLKSSIKFLENENLNLMVSLRKGRSQGVSIHGASTTAGQDRNAGLQPTTLTNTSKSKPPLSGLDSNAQPQSDSPLVTLKSSRKATRSVETRTVPEKENRSTSSLDSDVSMNDNTAECAQQ